MALFNKILVPVDFGDSSTRAIDLALSLAERFEGRVTLIHAYSIPVTAFGYAEPIVWPLDDLARAAQDALDSATGKAIKTYARVSGVLVCGDPRHEILEAAKREHADLIVMGTHGRRGLARAVLGSVAESVVRVSPVPVLTVPMAERSS